MRATLLIIFFLLSLLNLPLANARKIQLKIYDKISHVNHVLMTKATRNGRTITFEWNEPHSDFKYFLEIYREGSKRPIGTMPVSNHKKILKFKKEKKKLLWRVFAKSRHGNVTKNMKKYPVPL